ncbi:unnamed protein product [Rhodiola kirilowii]
MLCSVKYLPSWPHYRAYKKSTAYIQNNSFSGEVPPALLKRKIIHFEGNPKLQKAKSLSKHAKLILGISVGLLATLAIVLLVILAMLHSQHRKRSYKRHQTKCEHSDKGI